MFQEWQNDAEFQALPPSEKEKVYLNYFDQELADDEFLALGNSEQKRIQSNFLKSLGIEIVSSREPMTIGLTPLGILDDKALFPDKEPEETISDTSIKDATVYAGKQIVGAGEAALSLASGMALYVPSKIAGSIGAALGQDPRLVEEWFQTEFLPVYEPYTEAGQQAVIPIQKLFEWGLFPAKKIGEIVEEKTGSRDAGYTAETAAEFATFGIVGRAVRAAKPKAKPPKVVEKVKGKEKLPPKEELLKEVEEKIKQDRMDKLFEEEIKPIEKPIIKEKVKPVPKAEMKPRVKKKPPAALDTIKEKPILKDKGLPEEKIGVVGEVEIGDVITDGLIKGEVLSTEGTIKFGRKDLPAFKVKILTGHEKGKTSLIIKEQIEGVEKPTPKPVKVKEPELLYHGANEAGAKIIKKQGYLGGHTDRVFLTPSKQLAEGYAKSEGKGGKVFAIKKSDLPAELLREEGGPLSIPQKQLQDLRIPIYKPKPTPKPVKLKAKEPVKPKKVEPRVAEEVKEAVKVKPEEVTTEFGGLQHIYEAIFPPKSKKAPVPVKVPKEIKQPEQKRAYKLWKEFWTPFSTVPKGKEALFARSKAMGDLARVERFIDRLFKRFDKFPDDVKMDGFKYLDGQIPKEVLPTDSIRIIESIRQRTKTIGRMLVKRNIITQEQFNKLKGKYIHYMYAKHVLGDDVIVNVMPTGKLNLSYAKPRKKLSATDKKVLGQIEDMAVAVPVGMGKALTDIMKYDYLDILSKKELGLVWEPSIVKVPIGKDGKPVEMSIGKLVDEVKVYKKMVQEMPSSEIKARYETLRTALDKAEAEMGEIPKDFAQLPNIKTWGPLAGAYIRKPIFDDIVPLMKNWQNRGALFEQFVKIEQQGMALFKMGKVALNLPTAARNAVTALIIQNNMRGRALGKIPGDIVNACRSVLAKDKYHEEAFRHGLFKHNWSVTEINEILNTFATTKPGGVYANILGNVKELSKYYGKIDDLGKHSIYVQMRKAGNPVDVSILDAAKWGMDYSLASRSVKHLRQHMVPFISYQYKIAPLIAESLAKRPWVIGKFAVGIPTLAVAATMAMHDLTDKDWKKLLKQLPSYIKKSGSYVIMPWKSPEGMWQWVNLEYFFPWGNQLGILRDLKEGDIGPAIKQLGISNPYLSTLQMVTSVFGDSPPKHPYFGSDIYNRLDPAYVKAGKMVEAIAFTWAPSMLSRKGALGYSYSAAFQGEDKWGRKVTPAQAIARWFGINIVTISPKQTKVIKRAKIKQLRTDLYRIMTDPRKGKSEKKRARATYREKKKLIEKNLD